MTKNVDCGCGKVEFHVSGKPLMRAYCHCTICQSVNKGPYADITLFRAKDVSLPNTELLNYKAHAFPPILQRGKCKACDGISVERLTLIPMNEVIIVPSSLISDKSLVPEPLLHIFYETRVEDMDDDLPKYSGYLKSQLAFGKELMTSLIRN